MVINEGLDIVWGDLNNDMDVMSFTAVSDPEHSILIHCGAVFNFYQPYDLQHHHHDPEPGVSTAACRLTRKPSQGL